MRVRTAGDAGGWFVLAKLLGLAQVAAGLDRAVAANRIICFCFLHFYRTEFMTLIVGYANEEIGFLVGETLLTPLWR